MIDCIKAKVRKYLGKCPCCNGRKRLSYSVFTDEVTCWKCGLVGSVSDFRKAT